MRLFLGILGFVGCRLLIAIAIVIGVFWFFASSLMAAPLKLVAEAPPITVLADAIAYRNVVETGDLLILYRYNLPAGFDVNDEPLDWQQYGVNGVLGRVIWQAPPALQDRVPPSLGHALMGHYLEPGHGASWGSTDLVIRLQGNPALFESVGAQERAISYTASGADSATLVIASSTRRAALCDVFEGLLQAVEQADSNLSTGDLVTGSVITADGTQMAADAFSGAISLLPECFTVGVEGSGTDFDPPAGQLGSDLVTGLEASDFWTRWRAAFSTDILAQLTLTFILVGIAFGVAILLIVKTTPGYGILGGIVTLIAGGLWAPWWLVQVSLVIVAILALMGAAFIWARMPRG